MEVKEVSGYFSENKSHIIWIVIFLIIFIFANLAALLFEQYFLLAIPVVLAGIYLTVVNPLYLVYLIAFFTPLSFIQKFEQWNYAIILPTEPLIITLTLLFIIRQAIHFDFDSRVLRHPITLVILFNLLWILVTSFTSTMPVVSFKFFASRLWYVAVFYFLAIYVFKKTENFMTFIWLFIFSLSMVVIYAVINHRQYFFAQEYAQMAAQPFFKDHTVYGVTLAFCYPMIAGFFILFHGLKLRKGYRWLALGMLVLLSVGLFFSYTRAAWLSIVAALAFLIVLLFRIRFLTIFSVIIIALIVIANVWTKIIIPLHRNKAVKSTDLKEHVSSIYNISTDASNTERINRWSCALRMFEEKPLFGWGPGTYQFQYGAFQLSSEKTIISTVWGDLGNAHSEYLGPLAESGLLGLVSFFLIVFVAIFKGMNFYYNSSKKEYKYLALLILLSLTTYFTHGFINNFLDTDKASVLFWSFLAMLTVLDVYYRQEETPK